MSVDYHRLLWQELNKNYGDGVNSTFVMAVGQQLGYSDYSVTNDEAGYNTFKLLDQIIRCGTNYSDTGSRISIKWEQLLKEGRGPEAGPQQKAAFEKAKAALYIDYDKDKHTALYDDYIKKRNACEALRVKMEFDYQDEYGDGWRVRFDKMFPTTSEYQDFQDIDRKVRPLLRAIDEWVYGPLANVLSPIKEAFDKSQRSLKSDDRMVYYQVSMTPANWYQWFDESQFEDSGAWITINVNEHSDNEQQSSLYRKLSGSINVGYSCFLSVKAEGSTTDEKKVDTGDSRDVKITFKVRSVQISRPWIDLSALRIQHYKIPGEQSGSWSTGKLESSNDGTFPLLTTQMIVAKDIKVTASKFSREVIETMKKFDGSVNAGLIYGVFSFGAGSHAEQSQGSKSYKFDEKSSSLTLLGTQVIGYVGTLLPKYPA